MMKIYIYLINKVIEILQLFYLQIIFLTMAISKILIVDDEEITRQALKLLYEAEGYDVFEAFDGDSMFEQIHKNIFSLILLDINLPGRNGLLLARELKKYCNTPLIFLTGRDNDIDKILGLEIGADDYIIKPYNPRELTIRSRNLLNRVSQKEIIVSSLKEHNAFSFCNWLLDLNSHSLISPTKESFSLPKSEFRTLKLFCQNPGKIQSRATILKYMNGRFLKPNDRTVDVTIRRIRKYFEIDTNMGDVISTVHGEGYRFCCKVDPQ